ncbi:MULTISPECIES: hypothetical protein [Pacificibacter]|uniref:hypothetical protein n=1 Tax=Pacificibacter TaxID=1042323 RepID=UPI001C098100|nr:MULTISPECIES: hypothetical protein [Pacificibacter]MBU2935176.1 hypothetical protein [Pacificibacter marinus]MDO6615968.1 hypothetical protein [Pacificibacter sp. 1_MG-2023]
MAKVGDGKKRSSNRQQHDTMSLRVHKHEKQTFAKIAEQQGYPTLSAWHRDQLHATGDMCLRRRQMIVGELGQIGASIVALAAQSQNASPDETHALARLLTKRIHHLQRDIMKEVTDVGKKDS